MKKQMFTGFILVGIIIIIIFYLITNIKQPYVDCNISHTDDLGVKVTEEVTSNFNSRSISKIEVIRKIYLPEKYNTKANLNAVSYSLKRSYKYLGKDVAINVYDDHVTMKISTTKNKPIILDNMEFYDTNGFGINIDTNTKSSESINLTVGDKYSEGEYMVFMKNYGYSCK